jgi:hypothetical protein
MTVVPTLPLSGAFRNEMANFMHGQDDSDIPPKEHDFFESVFLIREPLSVESVSMPVAGRRNSAYCRCFRSPPTRRQASRSTSDLGFVFVDLPSYRSIWVPGDSTLGRRTYYPIFHFPLLLHATAHKRRVLHGVAVRLALLC